MKNITAYILIAVLTLCLTAVVVYLIYNRGKIAAELEQRNKEVTAFQEQVTKADNLAKSLEAQLELMRVEKEKLNESLKDEIGKNAVYTTCRVPASGVRIINQARAGIIQSTAAR